MLQDYKDIWLIYSAAGIYWRVHHDDTKAIECLRRALFFAPADRVNIPLTNMAMTMVDHERMEDAIQILRMALVVDSMKVGSMVVMMMMMMMMMMVMKVSIIIAIMQVWKNFRK